MEDRESTRETLPPADHPADPAGAEAVRSGGASSNPLATALTPFLRTGGYYARAWRRYLLQRSHGDLPILRPTVALAGQALVDEVLLAGFRAVRPGGGGADVAQLEAEASEAAALYEACGWCERPEGFFGTPPP